MEKYNGNQKGFIYVSCDVKNREAVFAKYLEPLAADGVPFWWADGFDKTEEKTLARAKAVLLFLTKDYAKDKKLRDTLAAAVKHNEPLLCIYLEDVELDAALSMQTEAQQALFVSKYKDDETFVEELKKAAIFEDLQVSVQQKKTQKSRSLAAVAAAIVVIALVLCLVVRPLMAPKANEETMKALGLQGVSKEELEKMVTLRIIGEDLVRKDAVIGYTDDARTRLAYEYNMDVNYRRETPVGGISDLHGIEQLKNLATLQLSGQQITDASPAYELGKLQTLILSFNPIASLDGIEKLGELQKLDITETNVSEIPDGLHVRTLIAERSGLAKIPDFGGLEDVYLDADQNEITDFSNAGTAASYERFSANCDGAPASAITEQLKDIPIEEAFINGIQINSLKDLEGLKVGKTLCIGGSPISSLDGIERFEGIKELDLTHCYNLADLSAVNKLQSLTLVRISEDMEPLADTVDSRIMVDVHHDEDWDGLTWKRLGVPTTVDPGKEEKEEE